MHGEPRINGSWSARLLMSTKTDEQQHFLRLLPESGRIGYAGQPKFWKLDPTKSLALSTKLAPCSSDYTSVVRVHVWGLDNQAHPECLVQYLHGKWVVSDGDGDTASKHGTFVNRVICTQTQELQAGDILSAGTSLKGDVMLEFGVVPETERAYEAATQGDAQTLSTMLSDGTSPDACGLASVSLLTGASEHEQPACVKILLDAGARIDTCLDGRTALSAACVSGAENCVEVLLSARAHARAIAVGVGRRRVQEWSVAEV